MGDGVTSQRALRGFAAPGAICLSEDANRQVKARLDLEVNDLGQTRSRTSPTPRESIRLRVAVPAQTSRIANGARRADDSRLGPRRPISPRSRSAIPEHERRSRAGLFRRRHSGGHHHRVVAIALAVRHRAQFEFHLQGPGRGREAGRARARRSLRARRQRAQGWQPGAHHGQLIDTSTGAHLWADRFDGGVEDIFDLQDQVAASVVGAIAPKLEQAEIERAKRKPTESLDAYDYFLRGMAAFSSVQQGKQRGGAAAVLARHRARS